MHTKVLFIKLYILIIPQKMIFSIIILNLSINNIEFKYKYCKENDIFLILSVHFFTDVQSKYRSFTFVRRMLRLYIYVVSAILHYIFFITKTKR